MKEKTTNYEEKELRAPSGWAVLFLTIILYLAAIGLLIFCAVNIDEYSFSGCRKAASREFRTRKFPSRP